MAQNIRELVLKAKSTDSVDKLAEQLDTMVFQANNEEVQYYLLDVCAADTNQLRHLVLHLKEINHAHQDHCCIYIALLIGDSVLSDVADALLKTLSQRQLVQHFSQRNKALTWFAILEAKYQSATV